MFRNKPKDSDMTSSPSAPETPRRAQSLTQTASTIGPDLVIEGNVQSGGKLAIEGRITGEVRVERVEIGGKGSVHGNIYADNVNVQGEVNGNIHARQVALGASAKVVGDVLHQSISIESGAVIDGRCKHVADAGKGATKDNGADSKAPSSPAQSFGAAVRAGTASGTASGGKFDKGAA